MGELRACRLTKRYSGITVVRDVDFTVRPGEVVGYLGPNGSGKTTTLRMLAGFLEPSSGHAAFDGRDVRDDPIAFRRRLGYIPEEAFLYPFLSGREYLELIGRLRDLPPRLLSGKIDGFLELFGILEAADQSIGSYSKGMRQKVLIAAALLHDPAVIFFDEPESGLDVTTTLVLRHLVRTLAERGKAILYSSHILEVVERVCSRVIVIHLGAVVADDSVERLRTVMSRTSLEGVFAQLAITKNPELIARDLADVMAASGAR
jgi:ABC-2 type transport system ATP-binding protein